MIVFDYLSDVRWNEQLLLWESREECFCGQQRNGRSNIKESIQNTTKN